MRYSNGSDSEPNEQQFEKDEDSIMNADQDQEASNSKERFNK